MLSNFISERLCRFIAKQINNGAIENAPEMERFNTTFTMWLEFKGIKTSIVYWYDVRNFLAENDFLLQDAKEYYRKEHQDTQMLLF